VQVDYKNLNYALQLLDEAKQIYRKEAAKNKKARPNAKLYLAYGNVYAKLNDGSKAADNYYNATAYDSTLLQAYVGGAAVYTKIKNYTDSQALLDHATKIDPTYSVAYREQAELFYAQKQYDKAKEAYTNYMKYSENTAGNLSRYATMLYRSKNYEQAISTLNDAYKADPKNGRLLLMLAMTYGNLEDVDNGLAAYKKYFDLQEAAKGKIDANVYSDYGRLNLKKGNEEEAIKNYNLAIAQDTSYAGLHGDIATIYFKQKNWAGVISEYKLKAAAAKKNLSVAEYFNLGQAYYHSKKMVQSDSTFAKVTELAPTLVQAYRFRALSLSAIDSTSEKGLAKPQYEKIIELVSAMPDQSKYKNIMIEAYSYLGYQYFLKKDESEYKSTWREKYKENWEKVLGLDPENQRAKDALDNLKHIK
jgi:tetratricopeptide (TPR) repeat protein